jgi:hypothetical protein
VQTRGGFVSWWQKNNRIFLYQKPDDRMLQI